MSALKTPPMDPETEIDLQGIVTLSGTNKTRVYNITLSTKFRFPKSTRKGPNRTKIFSLAEVSEWLADNDLKSIKFTAEDRFPRKIIKAPDISQEISQLKVGIKPADVKSHGKTTRIRTQEFCAEETLNPRLTRFSHSGAEHRYVGGSLE